MYRLWLPLLLALRAWGASPDARRIVARADEVRNPQMDYTIRSRVTTFDPGGSRRGALYEVLVKGKEKAVVKTLEPAIERGQSLLMQGTNMWVFLPDVSKPVRVSLQQRLTGEVANGDLARANFSGDYEPKLLRAEKRHYVLELTAKSQEVTYSRVLYWVEKGTYHPHKAEFFAFSGKPLKTCLYQNYARLGGRLRPTRLVLENALTRGQKSILDYSDLRVGELPDKHFTKDYLKKLRY